MNDLTEKIKGLLLDCDFETFSLGESLASRFAKQLAPEIEKMLPRWIPVGERLPEANLVVLVTDGENTREDWIVRARTTNGVRRLLLPSEHELSWNKYENVTHWMTIPKGQMV